jgi:hypothetical protein
MDPLNQLRHSVIERPSSAAAAAPRALKLRGTGIAAAVCCSVWFGAAHHDLPEPFKPEPEIVVQSLDQLIQQLLLLT